MSFQQKPEDLVRQAPLGAMLEFMEKRAQPAVAQSRANFYGSFEFYYQAADGSKDEVRRFLPGWGALLRVRGSRQRGTGAGLQPRGAGSLQVGIGGALAVTTS